MYSPTLAAWIKERREKGLPIPINWKDPNDSEDTDDSESDDESVNQEENFTDSDTPEAQESVQAEDDPDNKEVRSDCDSKSTEDCHGGSEATRSVENSASVAENGTADRDASQTNSSVAENQDTAKKNPTEEVRNAKVQAFLAALKSQHDEQHEEVYIETKKFEEHLMNTIIEICRNDCGNYKTHQTKWDTKAMSYDVATERWDKVLHDKHWHCRPRELAIFWDQSDSTAGCFEPVKRALAEVARMGYRVKLYDCSNGIGVEGSLVWQIRKKGQYTQDHYNNGPRLKYLAQALGHNAKVDENIICPSAAEFIRICERADLTMVFMDYDCVETIWLPARKISRKKCPFFLDLEFRYDQPYQHNWNPNMRPGDQYPVPERWYRLNGDRLNM